MAKKFTADFFRVKLHEEEPRSFPEILTDLSKIPDSDARNMLWDKNPIRFTSLNCSATGLWEGDLVKIRMDYIPPKASKNGGIEPIELEDDEGIGEETAFLYDPVYNILALQRNRYAVGETAFSTYVQTKMDTRGGVELEPVLRADARERMKSISLVRSFRVKFARPTNLASMVSKDVAGLDAFMKEMERFGGNALYVTFSMGRRKGGMDLPEILRVARAIWKKQDNDEESPIEGLEVDGIDADGKKDVLDLLEFKLVSTEEIVVPASRSFDYKLRRPALYRRWKDRSEEIKKLFLPINTTSGS